MLKLILIGLIAISSAPSIVAKAWRGLVPMRSTRKDVEALLGKPHDSRRGVSRYYTLHEGRSIYFLSDYGEVYIVFAAMQTTGHRRCLDSVSPDMVMMIQVTPTKAESVNEFIKEPKDFRTFDPSEPPGIGYQGYVNEEEGFVLQAFKGKVTELVYLPSKSDQQPCAGYYLNPEEFVQVFIHPAIARKFDEYGELPFSDEKARLDNFAIQLQAQSTGRGVIIVYAGRKAMAAEAKTRANRVKDYLVRDRGINGSRLEVIDGGYRESFTVQLFIADQGETSPTPEPTVDPNKVEIIPVRHLVQTPLSLLMSECRHPRSIIY